MIIRMASTTIVTTARQHSALSPPKKPSRGRRRATSPATTIGDPPAQASAGTTRARATPAHAAATRAHHRFSVDMPPMVAGRHNPAGGGLGSLTG